MLSSRQEIRLSDHPHPVTRHGHSADITTDLLLDPVGEAEAAAEAEAAINQFSVLYPFPLDEFQKEAISTLLLGDSVMVAAPTGSGKTVVAEFGIYDAFRRTGRVFYTAPIKALSNQKFRDLRQTYGDDVGLLTGDVSENRDARIIVMTTEILRNMLLQSPWELDDVETIIFDEIHYLADPDRGTTWEESIILCPDHIQLICLSATVTNADEIADWIGRTHRPIRLVTHFERPVPLALYYFHDRELSKVVDHHGKQIRSFNKVGGELRRQPGQPGRRHQDRVSQAMDEPQPREIVDALSENNLLPAIYFLFSRNDCQAFAEQLAMMRPDLVTPTQAPLIEHILEMYLNSLRPEDLELDQVQVVTRLARKGIGFHHAGLLPVLKQLVEVLFGRGLMQVVFATDTLALGVNMPARTVVIGRMSKWDGRRRRPLIPNEFQQMAGRAGRRGMDVYGHVVVPYSPWIPFKEMLEVATGALHPVQSAFAIRYNTVLNLWDPPEGERVRQMLQRSLAQFQTSQRIRMIERDILEIESDIAGELDGRQEEIAATDEKFEEFRSLDRRLETARHEVRRFEQDLVDLRTASTNSTPWTEPGRQALRRVLRASKAGLVVHIRNQGWAIYLGRGADGGVGLFYVIPSRSLAQIAEYRLVDFVPDDVTIAIPHEMIEPASSDVDPSSLVSVEELDAIQGAFEAANLPDLDALAATHREEQKVELQTQTDHLTAQLTIAQSDLNALKAERDGHAFSDNKVRKEYQIFLKRRDDLEKERNLLSDILTRELESEDVRIREVIEGIRDVLHRFGYLRQGYPTEKADMLAEIFDNDGLILCELIDRGILDPLTPDELAELFSWFSFDRDFRYANHFSLPDRLVSSRRRLEELEHDILGEERDLKLFISEGHNPSFYGAALHWCHGWSMVQIGEQLELSEGDLVLTFNKTIDLMRQVREMLMNIDPEHPIRIKLTQAERLLRRGIVEQSLSLGFSPIAGDEEPLADESVEDDPDTLVDEAAALN